jgi:hypothetical protein
VPLSAADLQSAHAVFGPLDDVIVQRRTLYAAVLEMVSGEESPPQVGPDVLDNPAVRGHLGAVLAGDVPYLAARCRSLHELVAEGFSTMVARRPVRLASTAGAQGALADAMRRISGELQRHGADASIPTLLTIAESPAAGAVFSRLVDGVELAVHIAPVLALDLVPHVSLFAVLAREASGRLGSASAREFPGLVLIPEPETALEVAEALIHEGAHQKFFDLATTRAFFGARAHSAPLFSASWAPPGAPGWPVEQAFAAWHAYCCLSAFRSAISGDLELPTGSLLPYAAQRQLEIGDWLLANGASLGRDGHALLGAVLGRRPQDLSTDVPVDIGQLSVGSTDGSLIVRRAGSRALVARRSEQTELFWVRSEDLDQLHVGGDKRSI